MNFVPLEKSHRLFEGYRQSFRIDGVELMLVQSDGKTYLFNTTCPHAGASLVRGYINNDCIRCPKHGITFSMESGRALGSAAKQDIDNLTSYPLAWRNGDIGVYREYLI